MLEIKPNLFVIGYPKCGTTSICDLLAQHSEIYFCPEKEPRFFSHDGIYEKGLEYYENLFKDVKDDKYKYVAEGSTTYSESWLNRDIKAALRIYKYNPQAKIIYCVREPLQRIESNWTDIIWSIDSGFTQTEIICSGVLNITGNFNDDVKKNQDLVKTSNYWKRLQSYRNYFVDKNIKIVFFEEFKKSPLSILQDCCEFLEIDPNFSFQYATTPRNVSANKGLSTNFGRFARKLPGYHTLVAYSPNSLKSFMQPFIKQRFQNRPLWEENTKEWVLEQLRDDLIQFLEYCEKPRDYWSSLI